MALLLAGSAVALASLASFGVFASRGRMLEAPTPTELEAALMRVGVSGEALAAAGCSDADAANVGADARVFLDAARWASLQSADQEVRDAQADVDRLARLVRGGQADQEDLGAHSAAQATLASAQSTRDAMLDGLFDAAVADLEPAELTLLESMHANAARPVPLQYRVADRTDRQWTALRDALANLKTSDMCGQEPDSGCEQLVGSTDAEPAVAAAVHHLGENLAQVSTAYAAALGHE